jgi:hypothetical protein
MAKTNPVNPQVLLATAENLPFHDRPRFVAGLSKTHRSALRNYLDQLTNISRRSVDVGSQQSERVALLMQVDQLDPPRLATPSLARRKGTRGKTLAAATGIVLLTVLIVAAITTNQSNQRASSTSPVSSAHTPIWLDSSRSASRGSPSSVSGYQLGGLDALKADIDADQAQLRSQESRLQSIKSDVDHFHSLLSTYKSEIDHYESDARMGLSVDQSVYQTAIDTYNGYVRRFNNRLEDYNSLHAQYEALLVTTNNLIDQYNARLGR